MISLLVYLNHFQFVLYFKADEPNYEPSQLKTHDSMSEMNRDAQRKYERRNSQSSLWKIIQQRKTDIVELDNSKPNVGMRRRNSSTVVEVYHKLQRERSDAILVLDKSDVASNFRKMSLDENGMMQDSNDKRDKKLSIFDVVQKLKKRSNNSSKEEVSANNEIKHNKVHVSDVYTDDLVGDLKRIAAKNMTKDEDEKGPERRHSDEIFKFARRGSESALMSYPQLSRRKLSDEPQLSPLEARLSQRRSSATKVSADSQTLINSQKYLQSSSGDSQQVEEVSKQQRGVPGHYEQRRKSHTASAKLKRQLDKLKADMTTAERMAVENEKRKRENTKPL